MTNLSSTIKTIQNIMRKDSGVDGDAQRIGQLSWMLFLKIFSDNEENWNFYEEGYESPIHAELQWSAWASCFTLKTLNNIPHLKIYQQRGINGRI